MRLLDLYCGAGGAAVGYSWLGFDVVGVDIEPQPDYPFEFWQKDALEFLATADLGEFDLIHASPPCQKFTIANNIHGRTDHPDLIGPTRKALIATGKPYIIENVPGAPLLDPVVVCGRALGLNVKRHRLFETSFPVTGTVCPKAHPGDWVMVFGQTVLTRGHVIGKAKGGGPRIKRTHLPVEVGRDAMGIPWMNRFSLSEAVPPAYTEFIGRQWVRSERSA